MPVVHTHLYPIARGATGCLEAALGGCWLGVPPPLRGLCFFACAAAGAVRAPTELLWPALVRASGVLLVFFEALCSATPHAPSSSFSIRKRALDLLFSMCDKINAGEIVGELLEYLTIADFNIREDLVCSHVRSVGVACDGGCVAEGGASTCVRLLTERPGHERGGGAAGGSGGASH